MKVPATVFTLLLALWFTSGSRALEPTAQDRLASLFDEALGRAGRAHTRRAIDRDIGPNGELTVTDRQSGVGLTATLDGVMRARATRAHGRLTFEDALGVGTRRVILEQTRGLEDWVGFERRPSVETLRYRVEARAAGVRFVARTLELLDASGVPRVRMAPPWALDARGRRIELDVHVSGCAFDADARAPFGRPVVAPGAACEVELSWAQSAPAYPLVVDPTWSATDSLATARREMAIGVLADGTVLVAGGAINSSLTSLVTTSSAERFDPTSETFAAAASMPSARALPYFATLADGRLFVGGGAVDGPSPPVAGAIAFGSDTSAWETLAAPTGPRVWANAVTLPDGSVLVVGGKLTNYFGTVAIATTQRYDPLANTWSAGGSLATARHGSFVLARLASGRVLVAGGGDGTSTAHASAELYDPGTNAWTATGSMALGRGTGLFATLPSGDVVVSGGTTFVAGVRGSTATTEIYDPTLGTWRAAGPIGAPVDYRSNGALSWPDGTIVAPAGIGTRGLYSETFDPATETWEAGCDPTRTYLVAVGSVLLDDERALVVGGIDATGVVGTAWLSGAESGACDDGNPCTDDACSPGGGCSFVENAIGCDDGDACTTSDVCTAGSCAGERATGCDDAGVDAAMELDASVAADAATTPDAGGLLDAASRDASAARDASGTPASAGGCACRAGARRFGMGELAALLALSAVVMRRRARRAERP